MNKDYAKEKLELLLRDLDNYNDGEFWRQMARIADGATTGQPNAEQLQKENKALQAKNDALVARLARIIEARKPLSTDYSSSDIFQRIDAVICETPSESLGEIVRPYAAIIEELCNDYEPEIEAKYSGTLNFPCRQRDFDSDMDVIKRARKLIGQGKDHD